MGLGRFGLGRASLHGVRSAGRYDKLFDVVVQHEYYNRRADLRCFDFEVIPNARTKILMRRLGMAFRDDGSGFSVFLDQTSRLGRLAQALDGMYLSFFFTLKRPRFVNVTEMDVQDLRSSIHYFRNDMDEGTNGEPLPVERACFPIWFRKGAGVPRILSTAGEVQNVPLPLFEVDRQGIQGAYVDPSLLDEGRYILEGAYFSEGTATERQAFIYTTGEPAPLCLVDIFLAAPKQGLEGIYPLGLSENGLQITPRQYKLTFRARRTVWVYHIVPRSPSGRFGSLVIESATRAGGQPAPTFIGAVEEPAPGATDALAYRFTSRLPLPFQERSELSLRLRGKPEGMEERVIRERLPVASPDQVLRLEEHDAKIEAVSDIYVYI